MKGIGYAIRLLQIQRALIRHGLDKLLLAMPLLRPINLFYDLLPWNWFRRRDTLPPGRRLRALLEELGPIYVKLGQILSTRRDMLNDEFAKELSMLQDSVPPFPSEQAHRLIEKTYGRRAEDVFMEFDDVPIASASIAQVHAAKLKNGREVIVKLVRPGIRRKIEYDIGFMYLFAGWLEKYQRASRHLKPTNVIREFHKTILSELDLLREAANASQLKRNFAESDLLHVPSVIWELTRSNILVMERISGIQIDNKRALLDAGIDLKRVAERGLELFFLQVFRDSFFHADMHPGNIFVTKNEQGDVRFTFVDFGIMGSLSEYDQGYLAQNLIAFLERDYKQVAALHINSRWVPANTRVDDFESAIRTVCEPLLSRPMHDVSFGVLLLHLFQTARRFNMEILPQFLLLQKTLVNLEGLVRYIYPELDPWSSMRPMLDAWIRQRVGIRGIVKRIGKEMPVWMSRLPALPHEALGVLEQAYRGGGERDANASQFVAAELRRNQHKTACVTIGCALGIAALIAWISLPSSLPGHHTWPALLALASAVTFIGMGLSR